MSERLDKWHVETSADDLELMASIQAMQAELEDPTKSERRRDELRRRIGHLTFEIQSRVEANG